MINPRYAHEKSIPGILNMTDIPVSDSFPSGRLTFGVSTTELNRIYHGDLRMSIQHEIGEKHVLKAKAAYAKPKIIGNGVAGKRRNRNLTL